MSSITRQQRLYVIAGASILFVITLFFHWFSVEGTSVDFSGQDVVPSWWFLLVFAVVAAIIAVAEVMSYELPGFVRANTWMLALTAFVFLVTLMWFIDPQSGLSRKFGIWLAVLFALVAAAFALLHWREEER